MISYGNSLVIRNMFDLLVGAKENRRVRDISISLICVLLQHVHNSGGVFVIDLVVVFSLYLQYSFHRASEIHFAVWFCFR